ncbi:hypothetical protein AMATHDRAFT_6359 [Amanita thiersii Skay4041]|uniref:DUF6533 domain-containing protein n=1 Tax=Amanita thiersii Skay4041 TaxID=703135 RepID=A0A2A9NJ85_9AGAR|nr:hypothetical protein AMATHDRAFT_6359 [Amanita thiersii Skay4041]
MPVLVRLCLALASTVFLIAEFISAFRDECKYIWRGRFNFIKYMYIMARYPILLFQIITLILLATSLNVFPVPQGACLMWFYTQQMATVTSLTLLEATLSIRVYALHGKSFKTGMLLATSFTVETLCNIVFSIFIALEYQGNALCTSEANPRWIIPPSVATLTHQIFIWGLTVKKWSDLNGVSATAQKISHIVMRDGTWVMFGILAITLTIIPYDLLIGPITPIAFAVMCPAFSSATCRLILNIQSFNVDAPSASLELTTIAVESTEEA